MMRFANIESQLIPNPEPHSVRKVVQQLQAHLLTLLRMKLDAEEVAMGHNRCVPNSIISLGSDDGLVIDFTIIGMHEVKERMVLNVVQQWMRPPFMNLVPADLRNYQVVREATNTTVQ